MSDVTISVMSELELDELISSLTENLCQEHLIDFIARIDQYVCDWDFTEALYKHFKAEHKVYKSEVKLDPFVGI